MRRFRRNSKKMALLLCLLFTVISLSSVGVMVWKQGGIQAAMAQGSSRSSGEEGDASQSHSEEEEAVSDESSANSDAKPPDDEDENTGDLEDEPTDEPDKPIVFNKPDEMRAVYLVPGEDFLASSGLSADQIKAEIDRSIESAKSLSMNTVIVDTVYSDRVIYNAGSLPGLTVGFDILEYIVEQCRGEGLYVYAIYDAKMVPEQAGEIVKMVAVESDKLDSLRSNVAAFAQTYEVDGILIDDYYNEYEEQSYVTYLRAGGGIGFDNYMRQSPATVVETVSRVVRAEAPGMQVGLLTDSVWENADQEEEGSNTAASFTTLGDGNADTKLFVEEGLVDFVAVRAYSSTKNTSTPFVEVVSWWGALAQDNDIPLYVVHASSKACSDEVGWAPHDQLAVQVIEAGGVSGYSGSAFNSLRTLEANPNDATTTLVKVLKEEVNPSFILTELQVTKPTQTTYSTFEPTVTFTGASDPTSKLTINDEAIETDESGYFTVSMELKAGSNTFVIKHKEKTVTYSITRQVQILKDIEPTGSITTDGGMNITVSAIAYQDATVYATLNGSQIPMTLTEEGSDDEEKDSSYKRFIGEYITPDATYDVQSLGNITVYGSWQGMNESKQGASVKINKLPEPVAEGNLVQVIKDQAETFPTNRLDDISNGNYYPLPKGALDFAVGDPIVYKSGSTTKTYQMLGSDQRVYADDLQKVTGVLGENQISGITVTADGSWTKLILNTKQKISYTFKYSHEGLTITFHNTKSVPSSMSLSKNPIFSAAKWDGATLTLPFNTKAGFMGYRAYYDTDGTLVFRFNNPPSGIGAARIVVDPGHSGPDPGALGFLKDYPEKVINAKIAAYLAEELESRGANVLLIDTSGSSKVTLESRVSQTRNFNADLFVSVHGNSSVNSSASGVEAYYFYPFSSVLSTKTSANVSGVLNTTNRGSKYGNYYVTRCSEYTSILAECGFLSNKNEYEKIIQPSYQKKIAVAIADALQSTISAAYSGSASGTETNGDVQTVAGSSSSAASGLTLSPQTLTLTVGGTKTLEASLSGAEWSSNDEDVAKVDENGKVTAVSIGSAVITAEAEGESGSCTVTVKEEGSSEGELTLADESSSSSSAGTVKLVLSKESVSLEEGATVSLSASYEDSEEGMTWESSDEGVVTVDEDGTLTGVYEGKAVIVVTHTSGATAQCRVTVTAGEIYIGGFSLDASSLSLEIDDEYDLDPVFAGSNVETTTIQWKSSDESVAEVDGDGVVVAVGKGKATITATVTATNQTATCAVTVS